MQDSTIEWTDKTWNPVRGCDEIGPGCKNCYAKTFAERWRGVPGHAYEQGFDLRIAPDKLVEPLRWKNRQRIFVNSMSDLFHKDIPLAYIQDIAQVMQAAQWHTLQVLTKRSSRMRTLLNGSLQGAAEAPNIWWGVSVEDRKHGLQRLQHLREATHARVRWLSIEPLLEDLGEIDLEGINGVVVGGESGPRARPMQEEWVQNILRQCEEQHVPFFFKQWGGKNKKKTGRRLNGKLYNEQPPTSPFTPISYKDRQDLIKQFIPRIEYWKGRTDLEDLVFRKPEEKLQELGTERLSAASRDK